MPEFLANGGEGFPRRADVTVTGVEGALVSGKGRKQLPAVEVVLRKAGEPQPGHEFVAFLHEVAALVDFSEEQADGNVFGNFAFDAREFARTFVDPHEAAHFGVDGSEAREGLEGRVGIQSVFGKRAAFALLVRDKGE